MRSGRAPDQSAARVWEPHGRRAGRACADWPGTPHAAGRLWTAAPRNSSAMQHPRAPPACHPHPLSPAECRRRQTVPALLVLCVVRLMASVGMDPQLSAQPAPAGVIKRTRQACTNCRYVAAVRPIIGKKRADRRPLQTEEDEMLRRTPDLLPLPAQEPRLPLPPLPRDRNRQPAVAAPIPPHQCADTTLVAAPRSTLTSRSVGRVAEDQHPGVQTRGAEWPGAARGTVGWAGYPAVFHVCRH